MTTASSSNKSYQPNHFDKYTSCTGVDDVIRKLRQKQQGSKSTIRLNKNHSMLSYSRMQTNESTFGNKTSCSSFDVRKGGYDRKVVSRSFNPIALKAKECTLQFKNEHIERLNKRNKLISDNVDVMQSKYNNIDSNNYTMSEYHRLINISHYNRKAKDFYKKDYSTGPGLWKVGTTDKIFSLRKKFNSLINYYKA